MNDRLIGVLESTARHGLVFEYDPHYADDPDATPLSVSMPLQKSAFTDATVRPYLWGLLPDNERVIERWAREYGCSASDVSALLRNVGSDVAGAAQYTPLGETPEEAGSGSVRWVTDEEVAEFLDEVQRDREAWHPRAEGRWSLAGAQAKIALLHDAESGRWGVPSGRPPTTHILKPAIAGLDEHDVNEHLCLSAASHLGLRASQSSVQSFAHQRSLVVTRYDRLVLDGELHRIHQEDMCQALSVHPDQKYEHDGGPGSSRIGKLVHDVAGKTDAERLHDVVAYSWMIGAPDGHAKNFSLLLDSSRVRLAPMYDVASGLAYTPRQKLKMAQNVGGEYRHRHVEQRHWERFSRSIGLDSDESRDRIDSMLRRLPDAFADAERQSGLSDAELEFSRGLRDQLASWAKECLGALHINRNTVAIRKRDAATEDQGDAR